jgi:hypothetical protein
MSLKTYTSTPTGAQVTNKTISVKHFNYIPTYFGALRHHHQGKNEQTLSDKRVDDKTAKISRIEWIVIRLAVYLKC